MAKSARASSKKANNQKLKSRVFGPVETARTERLSAKLLQLVSEPRPSRKDTNDVAMSTDAASREDTTSGMQRDDKSIESMDVDQNVTGPSAKSKSSKVRIEKRRSNRSKAAIVFPRYKNGKRIEGSSRR